MNVSLKLQGGINAANQFDADKLKELTANLHVTDLLRIVEAGVKAAEKK